MQPMKTKLKMGKKPNEDICLAKHVSFGTDMEEMDEEADFPPPPPQEELYMFQTERKTNKTTGAPPPVASKPSKTSSRPVSHSCDEFFYQENERPLQGYNKQHHPYLPQHISQERPQHHPNLPQHISQERPQHHPNLPQHNSQERFQYHIHQSQQPDDEDETYVNCERQQIKAREFDFDKIKNISIPLPAAVQPKQRSFNVSSTGPPPLPIKRSNKATNDFRQQGLDSFDSSRESTNSQIDELVYEVIHHENIHSSQEQYGDICNSQEQYGDICNSQEQYGDIFNSQEQYGNVHNSQEHYGDVHSSQEQYGDVHNSQEQYEVVQNSQEQYGDICNSQEHYGDIRDDSYMDPKHVQIAVNDVKCQQEDSGFDEPSSISTSSDKPVGFTLKEKKNKEHKNIIRINSDTSNTRRFSISKFWKKKPVKGQSVSESVSEDEDDYQCVEGITFQSSHILNNYKWFQGKISREEADRLIQNKEGAFLVKESERCSEEYSLYVCHRGDIHRFRITKVKAKQKYQLSTYSEHAFYSIPELVNFYCKNVIVSKSNEILLCVY